METLYTWLLFFGGVTLLLLGLFLFVSNPTFGGERRQYNGRRRMDELSSPQQAEINSRAKLMPANDELVEKIFSLPIGDDDGASMDQEIQSPERQLEEARCANHELQEKIVNLKKHLHANERRLSESSREIQRIEHLNSKLQTEVANLKRQLQASQSNLQRFEIEHQQLLERLQKSESLRAAGDNQHKEVTDRETPSELTQTGSQIDQLVITNDWLLAEVDSLTKKLAASQKRVEELQAQQNSAKTGNQPPRAANQEFQAETPTVKNSLHKNENHSSDSARQNQPSRPHDGKFQLASKRASRSSAERNSRVGIIPAAASIAIVGAIAIGSVRTSSDKGAANPPTRQSPAAPESRVAILESSTEPSIAPTPGETEPRREALELPSATRSAALLEGAFETIHQTELFNGPSEDSALIGTLPAGMKINVISSRDGWLEVRSKHGTSGFVRQDAAVRINSDRS
jgi:hypothetical protein